MFVFFSNRLFNFLFKRFSSTLQSILRQRTTLSYVSWCRLRSGVPLGHAEGWWRRVEPWPVAGGPLDWLPRLPAVLWSGWTGRPRSAPPARAVGPPLTGRSSYAPCPALAAPGQPAQTAHHLLIWVYSLVWRHANTHLWVLKALRVQGRR